MKKAAALFAIACLLLTGCTAELSTSSETVDSASSETVSAPEETLQPQATQTPEVSSSAVSSSESTSSASETSSAVPTQTPTPTKTPAPTAVPTGTIPRHTTFYISPSGNDANAGTDPSCPLKTVAPINRIGTFGEGCKILFEGGHSYGATVSITITGEEGAPCEIASYGNGRATLTDANSSSKPILFLYNSQYITIRNINLTGTPGTNYGTLNFVPENTCWGLEIRSEKGSGGMLKAITVKDVIFKNTFGGLWIGADMNATVRGFDGISVTGCTFDGVYQYGFYTIGNAILNGGHVDPHKNVHVGYNTFKNILGNPNYNSEAQPLSVSNATYITIEHNYFENNCGLGGAKMQNPNGGSTAFGVSNCRYFKILYNEETGTQCTNPWDGCAIDADQDAQYGEIAYNLTYDNEGAGIQLGFFRGKTTGYIDVHHNVSYNDSQGCQPNSVQGSIRFFGQTDSCNFFNNTIVILSYRQGIPSCVNFEEVGGVANTNHRFWNNIFKVAPGIAIVRANREYNACHVPSSTEFLANCYDSGGGALLISNDNTNGSYADVTSLSAWRTLGHEKKSGVEYGIASDAGLTGLSSFTKPYGGTLLKNISAFDLSSSSACIGKAIYPYSICHYTGTYTDIHGNTKTVNSIGADTY